MFSFVCWECSRLALHHLKPCRRPTLPRRWRIPGLLGIAQLMPILDLTVVAVALPNLSPDLGMGRQQLTGVVSGDTLAFGGLVLLGGRAADLFGARRLLITGLGLFAGASLVAGLAPTGGPCWPAASCQGAAAAVLSPSALSLVVQRFDGPERERALASGRPWGGGPALGLAAGRAAPPPARAGPGCSLSTCPSGSRSPSA